MSTSTKVTVIGSNNLDITIRTDYFPSAGKTIRAKQVNRFPGGKGANQALAAAKLGAEVTFISAFGNDNAGQYLRQNLTKENVNLRYSRVIDQQNTGTAYIISTTEDNLIIIDAGANQYITCEYIDSIQNVLQQSDIILVQLEIPLESVWYICHLANSWQIPIILNPAPAALIPTKVLENITLITPNEHEILEIMGDRSDIHTPKQVFDILREKVIMTYGNKGVLYYQNNQIKSKAAHQVKVVDTTGAGDVFNGALARFWHLGLETAITLANAASALSITKLGAQSGAPSYLELKHFLLQNNIELN